MLRDKPPQPQFLELEALGDSGEGKNLLHVGSWPPCGQSDVMSAADSREERQRGSVGATTISKITLASDTSCADQGATIRLTVS